MLDAQSFLDGQVLLIDKPYTWSSFQVVNKLKYAIRNQYGLKKIKIGHAGTLDPLATGLLVICTGKMTKKIPELQGLQKEYTGTITLGATRPSYDMETEIDKTFPWEQLTEADVEAVLPQLTGELEQLPPIFSAKKVNGKRAYDLARKGEEVVLKRNKVTVHQFDIEQYNFPNLDFRIACSKGTYIRSLAHDLGLLLENGGHLTALRRTRIGDFDVADALPPEEWVKQL